MDQKKLETSYRKKLISMNGLTFLWFSILAIGGLFLLVFFIHNGFLPELDLSGALSLLAATSLVGLMLVFSLFILTGCGGLVMYFMFKEVDAKQRGLITCITALLGATGFYVWLVFFSGNGIPQSVRSTSLVVLVFVFFIAVRQVQSLHSQNIQKSSKLWGMILAALLVSVLYSVYPAWIFVAIYQEPSLPMDESFQWLIFGLWLLMQALFMGVVAAQDTKKMLIKAIGIVGTANIFLLILFSNNPVFLVTRNAQLLGIGSLPDIRLVVTETGCGILNVASDGILCQANANQSIYITKPLNLMSRIGKQVKIEYAGNVFSTEEPEKNKYAIIIPAVEVLGWKEERATTIIGSQEDSDQEL